MRATRLRPTRTAKCRGSENCCRRGNATSPSSHLPVCGRSTYDDLRAIWQPASHPSTVWSTGGFISKPVKLWSSLSGCFTEHWTQEFAGRSNGGDQDGSVAHLNRTSMALRQPVLEYEGYYRVSSEIQTSLIQRRTNPRMCLDAGRSRNAGQCSRSDACAGH